MKYYKVKIGHDSWNCYWIVEILSKKKTRNKDKFILQSRLISRYCRSLHDNVNYNKLFKACPVNAVTVSCQAFKSRYKEITEAELIMEMLKISDTSK